MRIIGYSGNKESLPILIDGLKKLEYRGYDSTGITIRNCNVEPIVIKSSGKIDNLIKKTNNKNIIGNSGMGHTRWTTHGNPKLGAHWYLYSICLIRHWIFLISHKLGAFFKSLFGKNKNKDLYKKLGI